MTSTPRQTIERFLQAAVSPAPGDLADCYAEQFVIEMPFAGGLAPARTSTSREEFRARVTAGLAERRYTRAVDVHIHETADPEVVVVEYRLEGHKVPDQSPFTMAFVMVVTVRDGLIVHSRDYSNPIDGARLLGRLPQLIAALTELRPADPVAEVGDPRALDDLRVVEQDRGAREVAEEPDA